MFRPQSLDQLQIPFDGRGVLVGMTGSGKTTLARLLLRPFEFVAILDAKGMLHKNKEWQDFEHLTRLREVVKSKSPRICYAGEASELRDPNYVEGFFNWAYERQNTFVYIDEVYSVTDRNEIPPSYHALLTRGRERGSGVLSATQRPMLIPQVIMSEAENWYVFRLGMEADRRKVEACIGLDQDAIAHLPKRFFYFVRADEAIVSAPLTLRLTKSSIPIERSEQTAYSGYPTQAT